MIHFDQYFKADCLSHVVHVQTERLYNMPTFDFQHSLSHNCLNRDISAVPSIINIQPTFNI